MNIILKEENDLFGRVERPACENCGRPIPAWRRLDAETCSNFCSQERRNKRAKAKKANRHNQITRDYLEWKLKNEKTVILIKDIIFEKYSCGDKYISVRSVFYHVREKFKICISNAFSRPLGQEVIEEIPELKGIVRIRNESL